MTGLTPKQARFVEEYLVDFNGAAAAVRAGFSKTGANVTASKLLAKPSIASAVNAAREKISSKIEVSVERIATELARIAFSNMSRIAVWGPNGVTFNASDGLTEDDSAAVAEVSETTTKDGGSQRVKLHDKLGALRLLGQWKGMFVEKLEHAGKDGKPLFHDLPEDELRARAKAILTKEKSK